MAGAKNRCHMCPDTARTGAGSIDYLIEAGALPAGPSDLQSLLSWPQRVVESVLQRRSFEDAGNAITRQARIQRLLADGLCVSTEYSGKQTAEFAVKAMEVHLQRWLALGTKQLFQCWRCCDSSTKMPQRFAWLTTGVSMCLLTFKIGCQNTWVQRFTDLLPESSLYSSKSLEDEAAILKAHQRLLEFLVDHSADIYKEHAQAYCHKHRKFCRLYPEGDGLLQLDISGPTCTPWSAFGARKGMSDQHAVPFLIWVAERMQRKGGLWDRGSRERDIYIYI